MMKENYQDQLLDRHTYCILMHAYMEAAVLSIITVDYIVLWLTELQIISGMSYSSVWDYSIMHSPCNYDVDSSSVVYTQNSSRLYIQQP